MGLFNLFQKKARWNEGTFKPYAEDGTNFIYNLLFCDDLNLLNQNPGQPAGYPMDILLSASASEEDIQRIIDDAAMDVRYKVLAYNKQLASGKKPGKKELLAVILEIGLKEGLDVLAAFSNGTARYINHKGRMIIWETGDDTSLAITNRLFTESRQLVERIGPWDKQRLPCPLNGNIRITFLVSDGLYFGEGPANVMFKEPLAAPALAVASELMSYLVTQALKKQQPAGA